MSSGGNGGRTRERRCNPDGTYSYAYRDTISWTGQMIADARGVRIVNETLKIGSTPTPPITERTATMHVVDDHHYYLLENFENKGENQEITFIKKAPSEDPNDPPGTLVTVQDGTTDEEVLEMLIHRVGKMHQKLPSDQSAIALQHLRAALTAFKDRTAERKARGVEGTANA